MKVSNLSTLMAALLTITASFCAVSYAKGDNLTKFEPFEIKLVRLLDGPFKQAMEADRRYLMEFEPNEILYNFYANSGLPVSGTPLGGWLKSDSEVRGHFEGHYISACSLLYASTGEEIFKSKVDYIVSELYKCQQALGGGYLSAFPESFFDRLEAGKQVQVPYYTIHKIMAGLFDAYQLCGNQQALEILNGMASYFKNRLDKLSPEQMTAMLNTTEEGGMCDVLWNLYSVTGNPEHRDLAIKFEKSRFLTPMSLKEDVLTGIHGNTHIPLAVGAGRRYELTGDEKYRDLTLFFWDRVVETRSYVTGGSTTAEMWCEPYKLADTLSFNNHECCKTHNMLKLTRHLICWTGDVKYADYYERALFNGIMGTQDPATGMLIYYVPMATGYKKDFGTPKASFWCCYGTGVESFSKLGDSIYFHDKDGIYVNLFIASTVDWPQKGVSIEQNTDFPQQPGTRFTIHTNQNDVRFALNIRVPYWIQDGFAVKINNTAFDMCYKPSTYFTVERVWKDGDVVEVDMPMALYTCSLPDDAQTAAVMYGPIVLAGLLDSTAAKDTRTKYYFLADTVDDVSWLKPVEDKPLTFQTSGQPVDITFIPFNRVIGERYGLYWQLVAKGSPRQLLLDRENAAIAFLNEIQNYKQGGEIESLAAEYQQLRSDPRLVSYYFDLDIAMAGFEKARGNTENALDLIQEYTKPFITRESAEGIWSIIGKPQPDNTVNVKPLIIKTSAGDNAYRITSKGLRQCAATDSAAKKPHIYFSLPSDTSLRNINQTVIMTITYYSDGNDAGTFCIEYDGFVADDMTGGSYTATKIVQKSTVKGWHEVSLECPNARFAARQNYSADFRLNAFSDGDEYISSIRIDLKTQNK